MRRRSQYTSRRICKALLWVAFIAFIPSPFVKAQSPAGSGKPATEITEESVENQPGKPAFDVRPDVQTLGHIDLKFEDLPNSPGYSFNGPDSASMVQSTRKAPETTVQWRIAIQESLLYTGVMHTFNLWTEAGTRDALYGPWLQNYLDSVGELRGWSDSDRFMAPYVGHTIEGSVFGYIERQNDPRYRKVQWGDGRDYYMSLLHSLAYAAVWHTQWKIGPISEASIGNVMLHASPGFITLADTPVMGVVDMMAEDAADRYLITGLENRTTNRVVIILARSFLNPGRSFANVMAFHLPWRRDNRLGLLGEDFVLRKELVAEYKAGGEKAFVYERPPKPQFERTYPKEADIELTAFPVYETFLWRRQLHRRRR